VDGRIVDVMTATTPKTSRLRIALVIAGLLVLAGATYAFYPRQADLRVFDPSAMAQAETLMWRHYYEKRNLPLFADLYGVARDQQGFSPADSVRIAFLAARAATSASSSRVRAPKPMPLCPTS
jgi:hypothetical protein